MRDPVKRQRSQRTWAAKPENRAKQSAWHKKDRLLNPEKYKLRCAKYRAKNKRKIKLAAKEYWQRPEVKKQRKIWVAANKARVLAAKKRSYKKNAEKIIKKCLDRNKKYPKQFKAQWKAKKAVRYGRLLKQPCRICKKLHGKEIKAEAHHCDYNKPLEIQWLCRIHHKAWHRVLEATA